MAEHGQHDMARELLAELTPLRSAPSKKFILVAGDEELPDAAVGYAAGLAVRLTADVVLIAPRHAAGSQPAASLKDRLAARLAGLTQLGAATRRLAAVAASTALLQDLGTLLHDVCAAVPGVEFAVIDGRIAAARGMRFELPVFHLRT